SGGSGSSGDFSNETTVRAV
ncbi:unnamed protein product, partial [Allacma fusca]